jgi:hypothetical protein
MAGVGKLLVPLLGSDNWSVWKDNFEAYLAVKGLSDALEEPDSEEGKKASKQAKTFMILFMEDANVKLIKGTSTAAEAWKKLQESFRKTSNARVAQLRNKLSTMKMGPKEAIVEYLGALREIKLDLETADEAVSNVELAMCALRGLPKGYKNLVEIFKMSDAKLNLDTIQAKLMQKEQELKLEAETGHLKVEEDSDEIGQSSEFVAKHGGYGSLGRY